MRRARSSSSRPLLDWVLCRGRQLLRCQVERTGHQYRVSAVPQGDRHSLYVERFEAGLEAFQRHAALVAALRGAGWMSVAYR